MRWAVIAVGVCVLVGVMTTIAVAWTLEIRAAGSGPVNYAMTGVADVPMGWMRDVPPDWPDTPLGITMISPGGYFDTAAMTARSGPTVRLRQGMNSGLGGGSLFTNDDPRYVVELYQAGWPWKTMERRGADDARPPAAWGPARLVQSGVTIWTGDTLPLAPVWPGFWLSSAMWAGTAGLFWVGALVPGAVRRRRRRRGGRCVRCGYMLKGLGVCPECGASA